MTKCPVKRVLGKDVLRIRDVWATMWVIELAQVCDVQVLGEVLGGDSEVPSEIYTKVRL